MIPYSSNPHVLDDEVIHRQSRVFHALGPILAASFIKDDVAHHSHALGHQIKDTIRLGTLRVPDEDIRLVVVIELPHLVQLLDVSEAAESATASSSLVID